MYSIQSVVMYSHPANLWATAPLRHPTPHRRYKFNAETGIVTPILDRYGFDPTVKPPIIDYYDKASASTVSASGTSSISLADIAKAKREVEKSMLSSAALAADKIKEEFEIKIADREAKAILGDKPLTVGDEVGSW